MKYTTTIAAALAAGVSADDWSSWSDLSTSVAETTTIYCPSKVTQTVTTSATCAEVTSEVYATTVTVEVPSVKTITVWADGKTADNPWEEWVYTTEPAAPTSLPHGCVPMVVTETETAWSKLAGSTTTVTKSTLFVGVGECTETVTVTATEASPTWSTWSTDASPVAASDGGWSTMGKGPETTVPDVWSWTVPLPTNTKSWDPPAYTEKPDGSYGYEWGSWDGPGSGNGSTPWTNVTAGSPGSNVTKPITPLSGPGINSAGDRGSWSGGFSSGSNPYNGWPSAGTCTYDLTLTRMTLSPDGTPRDVIAVNGQVPGPLIECNWGDMISVTVHNQVSDNGTSIHWHGFLQHGTNDMDGVPGITECPIAYGDSKTYTFRASSFGTSWYHSHFVSQYGDGALGPIIIHGPATADYDYDMGPVVIQDVFNVTAAQQNYRIAHFGPAGTANWLLNGHNVKPDLSAGQHTLWAVEKGKKYLFRFINTAAQNMFSVSLDNHKMQVIAADFVPIQPYETEWLNIGIGQRYDCVIEMDQPVDSYFLRAVTQLSCPSACDNTGLGNANGIVAYNGVDTAPYQLPTSTTTKTLADFNICNDEPLASLVPFVPIAAGTSEAFSASASTLPVGVPAGVPTSDDGVVFVWNINNGAINVNYTQPSLKTLAEGSAYNSSLISNPIVLMQQNEWVYFVIQNDFFAAHPIHIHGHDICILGQGSGLFTPDLTSTLNFNSPPRRDTVMLQGRPAGPGNPAAPSGYTVIGFQTDNPGTWLMHCHIIWHVDGGLALQWIERPQDITYDTYVDEAFNQECSAYAAFEATTPAANHLSGESGLRRRSSPFFDAQVAKIKGYQFDDVVRRSSGAKHYLDTHLKRGLGDGALRRHRIARR